jgi:hypothetical protein
MMVESIMGHLKKDSDMDLENITLLIKMCMKDNGKRIRDMGKASIITQMEKFIEVIINKDKEMGLASLIIKMVIDMKENGKMVI